MAPADDEHVEFETPAQWRAWLAANHDRTSGVWLVTWKPSSGRATLGYEDAVIEALAYGWVDSRGGAVDAERSRLWFTRRKPASPWSLTNKARVARLEAEGRMAEPGRAAVRAAQANGMWSILDDAQNLVVPPDLAEALADLPGAREQWDAFSASARRMILEWIALARRPDTRARRVEETARKAAQGERSRSPSGS
jgi:uncharacterized protein YdeI (YjbR/CyaY-like superfamily)